MSNTLFTKLIYLKFSMLGKRKNQQKVQIGSIMQKATSAKTYI